MNNIFPRIEKTLLEKTLYRFETDAPISKTVKGMFRDETPKSYSNRFKKAKSTL